MDELLVNPVFQAGIAPFLITLLLAAILRSMRFPAWGISVVIGFLFTVYLIMGDQIFPITSQRKIVLLALAASVLGILLDFCTACRRRLLPILPILAIVGALWLIWPPLMRKEGSEFWWLAIICATYIAWQVVLFEGLRGQAWRASVAIFIFAIGTGLSVLLAASALLSQLSLAIAAGAAAMSLVALFGGMVAAGSTFTFFSSVGVALVGIGGHVYAQLPLYILLPLSLIPLLAHVPLPKWERWKQMALIFIIVAPAAGIAIYLTLRETGAPLL